MLSSHVTTVLSGSTGKLPPDEDPAVVDDSFDPEGDKPGEESGLASDSSLMGTSDGGPDEGKLPALSFSSSVLLVGVMSGEVTGEFTVGDGRL